MTEKRESYNCVESWIRDSTNCVEYLAVWIITNINNTPGLSAVFVDNNKIATTNDIVEEHTVFHDDAEEDRDKK